MAVDESFRKDSIERLSRMVSLLGFRAEVGTEESEEGLILTLKTEDAGRLIGRKGHCLQALELLLDRMLRKQHGEGPNVQISIDGYRNPREPGSESRHGGRGGPDEERLRRMAEDTAKEVKRWGEPQKTAPLTAAERRIVHMTLRADHDVETESEEPDQNGRKRVLVRLARRQDA
jgi:spoIIIJ-associated protein